MSRFQTNLRIQLGLVMFPTNTQIRLKFNIYTVYTYYHYLNVKNIEHLTTTILHAGREAIHICVYVCERTFVYCVHFFRVNAHQNTNYNIKYICT